jgi:hypothetical protein
MVKQYPYTLKKQVIVEATRDSKGNFIAGSSEWVVISKCRDGATKQRKEVLADGTFALSNHLIFCPKGIDALSFGTNIQVVDSENLIRVSGSVVQSSKGQLHTRIWL